MNLVLDSIVVVVAPGGMLRKVPTAPRVSAKPITAPPCIMPPTVQISGRARSRPTTRSGVVSTSSMPSRPGNCLAITCCTSAGDIGFVVMGCPPSPARCPASDTRNDTQRRTQAR